MRKRSFIYIFVICAMCLLMNTADAEAAGTVSWNSNTKPAACSTMTVNIKSKAYMAKISSGYMRVFYDGSKICIEYYDDDFTLTRSGTLDMELDTWGGFYSGTDGYYIVEGQSNAEEDDNKEVIRVIRYNRDWERTGAASIKSNTSLFGGEVGYPFSSGSCSMCEYGGKLYLATGHRGYVDESVGQGHQGLLLVEVDKSSMTGSIVKCDLWHSFAQHIAAGSDGVYIYEQSEGSRCTRISKYDPSTGKTSGPVNVLEYGGSHTSAWAIACYATVDGMALSSDNALGVGTSIEQSQYDNYSSSMPYNIYLTVTPKNNFTSEGTQLKWLTSYTGGGKRFDGVSITKLNDNRFLVAWGEYGERADEEDANDPLSSYKLHYLFVDGMGNVIGSEHTADAPVSDCRPIPAGNKVTYYASNSNSLGIYSIDTSGGSVKKMYRLAGANAEWKIEDGVLSVTGTGNLTFTTEGLSSDVKKSITKVIVGEGIRSIPDNGFAYLSNLESVVVEDGLESIGKEAFYRCTNKLKNVTIPSSVTSIGEDIVWTGYYWTSDSSHVTYATINAKCDSYAINYAKSNNIRYKSEHDLQDHFTVDKEPTCTEPGSKSVHCNKCTDKTDVTSIPASGHSMGEWSETAAATCTENGQMERRCSKCSFVETKATDPKGHIFTAGDKVGNTLKVICSVCGHEEYRNVPVRMVVWWRTIIDSQYYYSYPGDVYTGQNVSIRVRPEYADSDYPDLNMIVCETGDGRVLEYQGWFSFTYDEAGRYTVSVYPKDVPGMKQTETLNVYDHLETVLIEPDASSDFSPEENIKLNAVSGGKPNTKFTFVLIGDNGSETVIRSSNTSRTCVWTPKKEGTYRLRADAVDPDDNNKAATGEVLEVVVSCKHKGMKHYPAAAANCAHDGYVEYWYCSKCGRYYRDAAAQVETDKAGVVVPATAHVIGFIGGYEPTCTKNGLKYHWKCSQCGTCFLDEEGARITTEASVVIASPGHDWNEGVVVREATTREEGEILYTCKVCGEEKTEAIDKLIDPADIKGTDGTAVGPGASAVAANKAITGMTSDIDPAGAVFSMLTLRSKKQTNSSITLKWAPCGNAVKYVIYGNKCGKGIRMTKLCELTGTGITFRNVAGQKLSKGLYCKFLVVALDRNDRVVSASKLIHVATRGGKVGNHKSISISKSVLKKAKKLKKGKSLKLKAKAVAQSKKLKVKKHVALRYESSNPKIATVSGKGVVKGKMIGTCYIYVYAQNGIFKKIKVTVK